MIEQILKDLRENGYAIARQILNDREVELLKKEIQQHFSNPSHHGERHIQEKIELVKKIAYCQEIQKILFNYYCDRFQLVRALYFNKTEKANWIVPWHQDKTIAVKEKIELPGFIAWSVKQGVVHVQPPLSVMENIVTVRLHLDAANAENGALKIIPKSHNLGILSQKQIEQIKRESHAIVCQVDAGDAVIMSPLILHASLKATQPSDRRIIHLEYSSLRLPERLDWY